MTTVSELLDTNSQAYKDLMLAVDNLRKAFLAYAKTSPYSLHPVKGCTFDPATNRLNIDVKLPYANNLDIPGLANMHAGDPNCMINQVVEGMRRKPQRTFDMMMQQLSQLMIVDVECKLLHDPLVQVQDSSKKTRHEKKMAKLIPKPDIKPKKPTNPLLLGLTKRLN